ncbi:MAG TPA: ABC transporter permease subunit [Burkholderiaceae bacterium]|nr:ABC transporter permease subunit [Burkholderiaceae bacterium]
MRTVRAWLALVWLSFQRLLWSSGTLMVMFPIVACGLFLIRRRYNVRTDIPATFDEFSRLFVVGIFTLFVVPICAVAYATTSIGGDREDRTLLFLLTRPLPRALILLGKLAATLPLVVGLSVLTFYVYCRLAGDVGDLALKFYLPAVFYMALAYTCVFHLFAVTFRHSTIVALIYALFMEYFLGNLPGIVKRVAVNYYARSMIYRYGESEGLLPPPQAIFEPIPAGHAEAALAWISAGAVITSLIIFQRREYRDLT